MNAEIKAQWVAALRSGEFTQCGYALSVNEEYCCLGVLCELAARAGVVSKNVGPNHPVSYGWEGNVNTLPAEVCNWSGLTWSDPYVDIGDDPSRCSLSKLNDFHRKNFNQIADIIEAQL